MRLIKLDDKRELSLKAIVYGCNTNKRLVGASFMTGIGSDNCETISFYDALKVVDEMIDDTIEAEPVKHGEWETVPGNGIGGTARCSVCGEAIYGYHTMNYCPNCGAKMDGGNTDGN